MSSDNERIREAVKEYYGAAAAGAEAAESCCQEQTCSCTAADTPRLYEERLLADLPVDVSGFSLGCGDPVTIASLQPGEVVLDLGSGGGLDCFIAARQVGEAGRVIGVDMTPQMLARAEAKRATLGLQNVEFRQGQIECSACLSPAGAFPSATS